jgi:DeoR/GlpR family transcriptional regulator of sugar metabolism
MAFIGVTGVNASGFYAADISEVQIKTELVELAERVVVPMDHSKVGLADFITICPLHGVQTVVTDRADDVLSDWLKSASVELLTPGRGTADGPEPRSA